MWNKRNPAQHFSAEKLAQQHDPEAIRRRLEEPRPNSGVQDAVLGAIDGCVTTFAIIAAAHASGLPNGVIVLLSMANLLADALSMAVSNYNAVHTARAEIESARRTEQSHIDRIPEGEREEIRQIFAAKGFAGEALEHVVSVITSDRNVWINTMLREELGLQASPASPLRASIATFVAFLIAGSIPLSPFFIPAWPLEGRFPVSAVLGAVTFFAVGLLRGRVFGQRPLRTGVVTLVTGGAASAVAYVVGVVGARLNGSF
jgi:VIT1/CCC1 family predicted Fe2+/Mn2+ transporter